MKKTGKIKIMVDGVEEEVDLSDKEQCSKFNIHFSDNDYSDCFEGIRSRIKGHRLKARIIGVTPLLATVAFLLLGFLCDAWHPGWIVFFAIPIVPMLLSIFDHNKKKVIMNLAMLISIIGFFVLGFVYKAWHPGWVIFFLIPITGTLCGE